MSKIWKAVSTVSTVALVLGVLCILAGVVTGADMQRIKDVFYAAFEIENLVDAFRAVIGIAPLH